MNIDLLDLQTCKNPRPAVPPTRPSLVDREVMCRSYHQCLDLAVGEGWPGFSCSQCRAFEREHLEDPDWWNEQGERARWLLYNAGLMPESLSQTIERKAKIQGYSWATDE